MKKLMVEVNYRLRNKEEYNFIKNNFIKNNYEILTIEIDNHREIKEEFIYEYFKINELRIKYDKIAIISNIEDVLFLYYRLYNFMVDDYIYFIDKYNYSFFDKAIIKNISSMNEVEKEDLDKVYINFSEENIEKLSEILKNTRALNYIKNLNEFDFEIKKNKEIEKKRYMYLNEEIETKEESGIEKNYMINPFENKLHLNGIAEALRSNTKTAIYYFFYIYKTGDKSREKLDQLRYIFKLTFDYIESKNWGNEICKSILNVFHQNEFSDWWKIQIYQLLISVKQKNSYILKESLGILENNKIEEKYLYNIIVQLFFNSYLDGVETYEEFNSDYKKRFDAIIERYITGINIERNKIANSELKIALVVDQLISVKHATCKAALDYAVNIKNYVENSKVKIFVEDNFVHNEKEAALIYQRTSAVSKEISDEHRNYLKDKKASKIDIYYSDVTKLKRERIVDTVAEVRKFNPDKVININNALSASMGIIAKEYDSYYLTLGLINWQESQIYNFYFEGTNKDSLPKYDNNIILKTKAITFEKKEKIYKREKFGIAKDDFVMISVSLIAEVDYTEEFLENIYDILNNYPKVKLILVGTDKRSILPERYEMLMQDKVIFIKYEENLGALYQICDMYINPPRNGGGYSVGEAMFYGLPTLVFKESRDASIWVGKENCVNDYSDYMNKIKKLCEEEEYLIAQSNIMKNRIKESGFEKHIKELFGYMNVDLK